MQKNIRRQVFHFVLLLSLVLSFSCGSSDGTGSSIDLAPFILQAQNDECSSIRNKLYVIDDKTVLWDRAGNCADNSYSQTLYGQKIDQVLCTNFDSIAGPQTIYFDAGYKELFDTMIANLDKPDLGLGPGHRVVALGLQIP
jgi:hypothetical protein